MTHRGAFQPLPFCDSTSLSANSSADISTKSQDSASAPGNVGGNSKERC